MGIIRQRIRKADDVLAILEKGLIVVLFSLLVCLIVCNIIARNLFHLSFQKAFEAAPAVVLWLALIGSSYGLKTRRHIRLELLLRFCPETVRRAAGVVTALFGALVMGTLCCASVDFVGNEVAIFGNWGWLSVIFPLFFALAAFRYATLAIGANPPGPADPQDNPRVAATNRSRSDMP